MANHYHGLVDHTMKNGLQINLKDAIEDVGLKVPDNACLWEYPEIIRNGLTAKTISDINLLGKDIINVSTSIKDGELIYEISTSVDTKNIIRPNYALSNDEWENTMSADDIIKDLYSNILPYVKGVYSGDMTISDENGDDSYNNTLFDIKGIKSNLVPNSNYIRLYLTSQPEPLYIYLNIPISGPSGDFKIASSDTVSITIENGAYVANISSITDDQINSLI